MTCPASNLQTQSWILDLVTDISPDYLTNMSVFVCLCFRWLVLDTDTRDLVSVHTDGNEIISNVKYSPGKTWLVCVPDETRQTVKQQMHHRLWRTVISHCCFISGLLVHLDGNFLAVASHDNFVYIYAVTENGRKYSRAGKCTVSTRP